MCLIAVAWQAHPRWRLVLVGNRDEFHARPSAPLARWADAPILAGRDLEAGGTWLGVTENGRCAVVTNVRDPAAAHDGRSRGALAVDFLLADTDALTHARALAAHAVAYRPFNLLLFDLREGAYVGNRPVPHAAALPSGVHGLSNADLATPWPKTRALVARLGDWLAGSAEDFAPLFKALADQTPAHDADLPDTGIGLERERALSPAFIRGEAYGTRASTLVRIDHHGRGEIIERRFGPMGHAEGETRRTFG